ncbi:hypothetical protein FQR65_LT07184 [Abscondita terminalis]|nr:hypothetical protein FQR65_LT07184 [Abscondita terminalis]
MCYLFESQLQFSKKFNFCLKLFTLKCTVSNHNIIEFFISHREMKNSHVHFYLTIFAQTPES